MSEPKSRGFTLSFGDIMLQLIGIVAMALLFIAGRLFFFSESRSAAASLPVIKETSVKTQTTQPPVPISNNQPPTQAAQPVVALPIPTPISVTPPENFSDKPAAQNNTAKTQAIPDSANTDIVLAVPYKPAAQTKPITAPVTVVPVESKTKAAASSPTQAPAQRPAPKPTPAVQRPAPKPTPAVQPSPAKSTPTWIVQVGAFSTAAAAGARSKELSSDGYLVSVVSGARLHRVLVRGGATRASASAIAAKIGQGAFVVPPSATK
jgi:cell division protein FtsN